MRIIEAKKKSDFFLSAKSEKEVENKVVRNCDSLLLLCCWGYFCIFVHLRLCCAILFARSRLALHWTTNEKKGKPLENPKKTCPTWIIFIQTQNSFRTICLRILQASWKQSHVSCISTWHENRLLLGGVVICFFVII